MQSMNDLCARIISIANIKGGVGKSQMALLLSKVFCSMGFKVCLVDADLQQTVTWKIDSVYKKGKLRNIAKALIDLEDPIAVLDQIVTLNNGLSILMGSWNICEFRSMPMNRMGMLFNIIAPHFDFIIVDTPGTWDSIVGSTCYAAHFILCPIVLGDASTQNVSINTLYKVKTECGEAWKRFHFFFNRFQRIIAASYKTRFLEALKMFFSDFPPQNVLNSVVPDVAGQMRNAIDYDLAFKNNSTFHLLYPAIEGLALEILGTLNIVPPKE